MSDKHMDEVMRDFAKKCKECDYCIEPQEEEACRECERKFIKKACRSYARKVCESVKAVDYTPDPRDETKDNFVAHACRILHELDRQITRLTDKEPT